jgi:uncharacterized protein (TIGR03067 family)
MLPLTFLTAALLLPLDAAEDAKKELEKIQGTWVAASVEFNGGKATPERAATIKVICKDDKYVQTEAGREVEKGSHKLDPSKKPKHMDITVTDGEQKGKTQLAIYELEGDTLKICVARAGEKDRPTEFAAKSGSTHILVTLKREKKEDKKEEKKDEKK